MSKIVELTREAGVGSDAFGWLASDHALQKFYTLARADLEADLVKHRELLVHHLSVIDPLRAMVADLQGACELHREEVTELQERRDQYRTERDALRAENAWLGKRHAALLESHAHLEAENAKLREVFETLLSNVDHATSCGAWNVQVGSQTDEIIEAARAALGEK